MEPVHNPLRLNLICETNLNQFVWDVEGAVSVLFGAVHTYLVRELPARYA